MSDFVVQHFCQKNKALDKGKNHWGSTLLTLELFLCELILVLVEIEKALVNWWGIWFIVRIVVLQRHI